VARITCDFVLTGYGLDPARLTQALSIQPARTWHEGEYIQRTLLRRKKDGWLLSTGPMESMDVQEVALPLLTTLRPLAQTLLALAVELGVEADISYTIMVEEGESIPAIHFDRAMLEIVNQLHAEIDVDLYV